jgi:hypothetical protein
MSNVRCPPARRGGKSLLATFGGDRRDIKKLLLVLKRNSLLRESIFSFVCRWRPSPALRQTASARPTIARFDAPEHLQFQRRSAQRRQRFIGHVNHSRCKSAAFEGSYSHRVAEQTEVAFKAQLQVSSSLM